MDNILRPILRSGRHKEKQNIEIDIEYDVVTSRPDIVVFINNKYVFSIENKIYSTSIESEGNELKRQYDGLKEKCKDFKIFMIFLVPSKDDGKVKEEDKNLILDGTRTDEKIIIEWEDVRKIIHDIIEDEKNGDISPIDEYVRQTLKAFSNFIKEDFKGYYYKAEEKSTNPLSEGRKKFDDIKSDSKISYVGVKSGIFGLFKEERNLSKKEFQYTTTPETTVKWIKKDIFVKIVDSITNNKFDDISWIDKFEGTKFSSEIIYRIAKCTSKDFYIGIVGGINALRNMTGERIKSKKWSVRLKRKNNENEWIKHDEYLEEIDNKKVFS